MMYHLEANSQSGMVMLLVLLWMAVITLMVSSLSLSVREQGILTRKYIEDNHVFYLAERELRCAEHELLGSVVSWCGNQPGVAISMDLLHGKTTEELLYRVCVTVKKYNNVVSLQAVDSINNGKFIRTSWALVKC